MLDINDITLRVCGKILLEHASCHIDDNRKIGLVGHNGCGKSTLIHAILGEQSIETGEISYPAHSRIACVHQEILDFSVKLLPYLLSADKERAKLLNCLEHASEMELSDIYERLNVIGSDRAEARACQILKGLGFQESDFYRPLSEFSGGWRMRVALATTLFQPSDILLLDEPTNHLDLESSLWLLDDLKKYHGSLFLISHDKNFLNSLCDGIVHFESHKLNFYSGNYDTFKLTRSTRQELQEKLLEKQEEQRQHIQSFIDRFRYKATKAKQAQSRLKILQKLTLNVHTYEKNKTHFEFPNPPDLASPIMKVQNVSVGYVQNEPVLTNLNLQIDKDDRIAILGANGNGKSTLAKLLDGRLKCQSGEIIQSQKLIIGYFAQHQMELLPSDLTASSYMSTLMPSVTETKVRTHLACFGLEGTKATTRIDLLSGGEKARLLFAAISYKKPQLLILDEPTNHLDIDAREALVEALNTYTGAVILITHDFNLIEMVSESLWLVKDGTCRTFNDDIVSYRDMLLNSVKYAQKTEKNVKKVSSGKEKYQQNAQKQKEIQRIKKNIKMIEESMSKNQNRIKEIENLFMSQLVSSEVINLQKELGILKKELLSQEDMWFSLNEKLEKEI